jgi:hypothetical protein
MPAAKIQEKNKKALSHFSIGKLGGLLLVLRIVDRKGRRFRFRGFVGRNWPKA